MNKKIAAIIAGSVAALGSAIVAAPAHAVNTTVPVEIEVQPSMYLVTYDKLKFLVNRNDFLQGGSVNKPASYDETTGQTTLPPGVLPDGAASTTVSKTVNPLYRVAAPQGTLVEVEATTPQLIRQGGAGTVNMEVATGASTTVGQPDDTGFFDGNVGLDFTFPAVPGGAANQTYTGGVLTISVVTP